LLLDGMTIRCQKLKADEDSFRLACRAGSCEIVKLLLDHNVQVKASVQGDELIYACHKGHFNIVKLLLQRGADIPDSRPVQGVYLEVICLIVVKVLLEHGLL
jgi:ankyrin repeat protein